MSSSVDADVRIILNAEDNASETVRDASRRINKEFLDFRRENQALERSMILNNKTFFETAQTISRVGNIAQKGLNIWQSYNISQIRVADAQRNVRDIQRDLNRAMAEGDFEAVARLTEELADANADLSRTSMDANIQLAMMIPAFAGMAADIGRLIPQVRNLANQYARLPWGKALPTMTTTATTTTAMSTAATTGGAASAAKGGLLGALAAKAGPVAAALMMGIGIDQLEKQFPELGGLLQFISPYKAIQTQLGLPSISDALGINELLYGPEAMATPPASQQAGVITYNNYIYGASTSDVRDHLADSAEEATVYD